MFWSVEARLEDFKFSSCHHDRFLCLFASAPHVLFSLTRLCTLTTMPYAIFDIIRIHANVAFPIANSVWWSQIMIDFQWHCFTIASHEHPSYMEFSMIIERMGDVRSLGSSYMHPCINSSNTSSWFGLQALKPPLTILCCTHIHRMKFRENNICCLGA